MKWRKSRLRRLNQYQIATRSAATNSVLLFGKLRGQFWSNLVFINEIDLSEAVKHGCLLGCSDKIQDVAIFFHKMIKNAIENLEKLPWPPTALCLITPCSQ